MSPFHVTAVEAFNGPGYDITVRANWAPGITKVILTKKV